MVKYTENEIKSLDWKEHIRLRPGMYIGKLGNGDSPDDGVYVANLIINNSSYVLVDTGGIGLTNNEIDFAVTKSSLNSFEESDLIIALFDSSTNLSKIDAEILNYIRKASVPFIPVLNKCDLKESENNKDLYYEEGLQNIIEISVTKKQGIRTLEKKIEEIFPSKTQVEEASQSNLRVGIIGKPNAGKSTFFNKLSF